MNEFKNIFLSLRKEYGYSQESIAKALGVSKSTVAMWETGKRKPSTEVYEAIADYFNVDMDYIYGKTDVKKKVSFTENGILLDNRTGELSAIVALDAELQDMIEKYLKLSDEKKASIRNMINLLSDC